VPVIDLVDETFIAASPELVAAVVHEPARWANWWPDLTLTVFMDRGLAGIRWSARGGAVGSCELWLEGVGDGVLVHHYVRLDPVDPRTGEPVSVPQTPAGWRRAASLRAERARDWKLHVWALKDELEGARRPGTPVGPETV
jgi:hypothetical protein